MYANTDSTNYATVTNSRMSTSSYYIYVRGFNFSDIPAGAIINSFTIKLKGNYSGGYSQSMYLYDGTSTQMGSASSLSSSVSTQTFDVSASWDEIVSAGADFGIRINCRRSSRNTTSYVYIYGAEIEVDYTLPVYHDVTITNNSTIDVSPSGTQTLLEGETQVISLFTDTLNGIEVTDNGTDVTGSLVRQSAGARAADLVPSAFDSTNSTVTDEDNACTGSDSSTYAEFFIGQRLNSYAIWAFDTSAIPADAVINSVACEVTAYYNGTSSNVTTKEVQLYSGSNAKGSAYTLPTSSSSSADRTFSLTTGSWTRAELDNIKLRFDGYYNGTYSSYYFYIYGATLTINYTVNESFYTYTISNIVADHAIVITQTATGLSIRVKVNGSWVTPSKVLVKRNGSWVEASKVLGKYNGTWK